MFNGFIYRTTNLVNGKWYIGRDETNDPRLLGDGVLFKRDLRLCGRKRFRKEILCWAKSADELILLEQKLLADYDAFNDPNSYNTAPGTKIPRKNFSCKMSERWRNYSVEQQEHIRNAVSKANSGRVLSADHKQAISKSTQGVPKPQTSQALEQYWAGEQGEQMRTHLRAVCGRSGAQNGYYGKSHSAEVREKISRAKKGKPNTARRKLSDAECATIRKLSHEGTVHRELAQKFSVSIATISRCVRQHVVGD